MSDKDDELTLRDKFAAAALPALVQRYSGNSRQSFIEDMDNIALLAYKIADAMRKARLQAFT